MLNLDEKIKIFKTYLEEKNGNYADMMKDEIYFCFFENEWDFKFLNDLNFKEEIEEKINFLISKMILLEDKEGLSEIIHHYI